MTWENYAIDIGSCYYLTKHYWQLKLLKFLDATFKKQCNGDGEKLLSDQPSHSLNFQDYLFKIIEEGGVSGIDTNRSNC